MPRIFITIISALIAIALGFGIYTAYDRYFPQRQSSPIGDTKENSIKEKPLEKFSIVNLSKKKFPSTQIFFDEAIATTSAYTKYIFHYSVEGKKATGLATIPSSIVVIPDSVFDFHSDPELVERDPGSLRDLPNDSEKDKFPVIIQFRGYVDRDIYQPGIGTSRSAEVYATHGYVVLAPDFLGYGGSDMPENNIFEERFQTYTVALQLYHSLSTVPFIDQNKVGIWGHSNGGHIALTVLEALGKPIPTTLWAPVTKPFPYSILYFTDEADDEGKLLRKELATFEKDYDVFDYSLTKHIDLLSGPIQLHQGTADDAVPLKWSDTFVKLLKDADKDITYYTYPGTDHNMQPSWDTVVQRDLEFFKDTL